MIGHKSECKTSNSPLHKAMRNNFENFEASILEEVADGALNEREGFYIRKFNSLYPNGYNKRIEPSNVQIKPDNKKEVLDCMRILLENGYSAKKLYQLFNFPEKELLILSKEIRKINLYSLNGELVHSFNTAKQAAEFILESGLTKTVRLQSIQNVISRACSGKQKTAYGFLWEKV